MLISHAVTLAEARSYVAALADNAHTFDASVEYEHVLLELDTIHGGEVPPLTEVLTDERDVLYTVAEAAIEELVEHGVDGLQVELVLARLEDARALDRP
ncbi:hypothetical protein GCM10027596_24570 [Nocardioides korecus]